MTFEQRVSAVMAEKFTQRQAAFLTTVMLHAGVCMVRHYCAFGHMVYGQTARDFFARLVAARYATRYTAAHAGARIYHVRHRGLYAAIGEPHSRLRKPVAVARAVERLMLLDAILERPGRVWLATEREKVAHFTTHFGTRVPRARLPHATFGEPPETTTRYFPDHLPIGVEDPGIAYTLVYLATRPVPVEFRGFLYRHAELLRVCPRWTVHVLIPAHLRAARDAYVEAVHQELATPVPSVVLDELRWYFTQRRRAQIGLSHVVPPDRQRLGRCRRAFGSPRYRALYRAWREDGDTVIEEARSPVLAMALERRSGRVECEVLPRPYLHLSSLVGTA
jgi:hypothetical protein